MLYLYHFDRDILIRTGLIMALMSLAQLSLALSKMVFQPDQVQNTYTKMFVAKLRQWRVDLHFQTSVDISKCDENLTFVKLTQS